MESKTWKLHNQSNPKERLDPKHWCMLKSSPTGSAGNACENGNGILYNLEQCINYECWEEKQSDLPKRLESIRVSWLPKSTHDPYDQERDEKP